MDGDSKITIVSGSLKMLSTCAGCCHTFVGV
jgi:hypothetical protein